MRTYFAARFNTSFTNYGVWDTNQNIINSQNSMNGCGSGGFVGKNFHLEKIQLEKDFLKQVLKCLLEYHLLVLNKL